MPVVKAVCRTCGNKFDTKHCRIVSGRGKYCSKECLYKAMTERTLVKCKQCNKEFKTTAKEIGKGYSKFCSLACYNLYRTSGQQSIDTGGAIINKCVVCGHGYKVKKYKVEHKGSKCCSNKCRGVYQSRSFCGTSNSNWRGGLKPAICQTCGDAFNYRASPSRAKRGRFCSPRCKGLWIAQNMKTRDTGIEIAIEKELIRRGVDYKKQHRIKRIAVVDFFVGDNIVIQCDGVYWHNLPNVKKKDLDQDFTMTFHGYKIFRFNDIEINKSPSKCIDKVIRHIGKEKIKAA